MPINKDLYRQVSAQVTIEEKEQLDQIAKNQLRTTTNLVSLIVKRFLSDYNAGRIDENLNYAQTTSKKK
jgi:hypothetical protein